ncbi:MAG TPA: hypothetical protein VD962_00475 [Rubricoccaceae bacterium]|nr:hypothetical protein [Rubricoccaceae bacterium]
MASSGLPRNPAALADHADGFVAALNTPAGQAASGLTAAQFTALSTAMTDLRTFVGERETAAATYRAAVEKVEGQQETAEALYRDLRRQANGHTAMTDELRALAGLPIRDDTPSPGALPAVDDLTAVGRPSGSNFLDWSGPTGGGLRYEVFTRLAAGGEWTLVGSSTSTDFLHQEAGAGVARYYRVVARRGERAGEPSNEAAVYV